MIPDSLGYDMGIPPATYDDAVRTIHRSAHPATNSRPYRCTTGTLGLWDSGTTSKFEGFILFWVVLTSSVAFTAVIALIQALWCQIYLRVSELFWLLYAI